MEYKFDIEQNKENPKGLEALYQFAREDKTVELFKTSIFAAYEESPENILFEAWYHRLSQAQNGIPRGEHSVQWFLAIPIGFATGLIFWLLSDYELTLFDRLPLFVLAFPPTAAAAILAYLTAAGKQNIGRPLAIVGALLGLFAYIWWIAGTQMVPARNIYLNMVVFHLPLAAWIGIGLSVLGWKSDVKNRFAFIIKSFEVLVTAGLFAVAGGIFYGVAITMFAALGISIQEWLIRLVFAGGAGVISVIAVASVYQPDATPIAQEFGQGVTRLMPILVRFLVPSTIFVLAIYIIFIFFNFRAPIENREVLIANNVMLFAIMGLLLAATPINEEDIPPRSGSGCGLESLQLPFWWR